MLQSQLINVASFTCKAFTVNKEHLVTVFFCFVIKKKSVLFSHVIVTLPLSKMNKTITMIVVNMKASCRNYTFILNYCLILDFTQPKKKILMISSELKKESFAILIYIFERLKKNKFPL